MYSPLPEVIVPGRSFVDTFVIGRFVAHLFIPDGFPKKVVGPVDTNFKDSMVRIWPTSNQPVEYPPPYRPMNKDLNFFISRYRWASRRGYTRTFAYPIRKVRRDMRP